MTWPLDQTPIPEVEEDEVVPPTEELAHPTSASSTGEARRSNADDVLDAVAGRAPFKRRDPRLCPKCGSATKQRGTTIGTQTITRRCQNAKCKNEYAVGSIRNNIDVPPPPPNPMLLGGPYKGGPDRGIGRPAIDPYEPINRRVAEVIRRSVDADD
jgi:hypothetical protein